MRYSLKFLATILFIFSSVSSANPIIFPHAVQSVKQATQYSHWIAINGPNDSYGYKAVQLNGNPNVLFAFEHGNIFYRSTDQGKNWELLHAPDQSNINNLISIAPNKLLFATRNAIYSSSDLGETWSKINQDADDDGYLIMLSPNLVFWIKQDNKQQTYYLSNNGGTSWNQIQPEIKYAFQSVAGRDNLIVVGSDVLSVSNDGGKTFKTVPSKTRSLISLLAIDSQHNVYVGDEENIYKTDSEFKTWKDTNSFSQVQEIQIDSQDNVYNSDIAMGGLYKFYHDDWQRLYSGDLTPVSFTVLDDGKIILTSKEGFLISDTSQRKFSFLHEAFKGLNTEKILALDQTHLIEILGNINVISAAKKRYVYSSDDGGKTWTTGFTNGLFGALDVAQFKDKVILSTWDNIYLSDDFGKTWKLFNKPDIHLMNLTVTNDLVIGDDYGVEYISKDLITWKRVYQAKTLDPVTGYAINGTLFFSSKQDIIATKDDGNTWQTVLSGTDKLDLSFITGYQDKILLAGYHKSGDVFKSTDSGQTWTKISANLADTPLVDVACVNENTFVIASENHLYITYDGGTNWQLLENDLQNQDFKGLFVSQNYLFANTKANGFFQAV